MEGQKVILCVVLADIDVVAVAADVVKRLAYGCARTAFFISVPAGFVITGAVLSFCGMSFDKSAVFKLPADLRKVALIGREVR